VGGFPDIKTLKQFKKGEKGEATKKGMGLLVQQGEKASKALGGTGAMVGRVSDDSEASDVFGKN